MSLALALLLALATQTLPPFSAPVVDAAKVVPDGVERSVGASLLDYQARTGSQIAIAVVKTTGRQSIEDYSIDLARKWGVGQKGKDNGVLLVIAYEDRGLRIEVGRGLEGELTDLESGRIIRDRLVPLLRRGDVGAAVSEGALAIRAALGDPQAALPPAPAEQEPSSGSPGWLGGLVGILFPLGLLGLVAAARRGRRRGLGGVAPVFWGGGWGGGSGGGGGGFGGGGGGGFGGGGASGSW